MGDEERKSLGVLLSLAASKEKNPRAYEEQQTQSMMYAARMTYLDDSEQSTPDPLFLTRKQAQKMAQQQDSAKMPFKRLETRKLNATNTTNSSTGANWKKGKSSAPPPETRLTWEPKFQAGCHFWQCVETGECRTLCCTAPTSMLASDGDHDDDGVGSDEEDPPFPDCFAFLNGH